MRKPKGDKSNTARVGDLLEIQAVAWLIDQDYEVFRNDCCTGPVDIIALDVETNEVLKIDVKTTGVCSDQKHLLIPKLTDLQVQLGVKVLTINKMTNEWVLADGKRESQHITF